VSEADGFFKPIIEAFYFITIFEREMPPKTLSAKVR
jgi:hypothetical protein